jgi:hypothetical protein
MHKTPTITEADILAEIIGPDHADLNPQAARSLLELKVGKDSEKRIRQLLKKNNRGTITADERATLEKYLRVGRFLDLLQTKARLSLKADSEGR